MKAVVFNCFDSLPNEVEESLNRLRVNIGFCGEQYKKIMITSSIPNEGKSLISTNLWKMLGESGKRVVFIDCDLRKSVLRSRYRISSEDSEHMMGLSHFLAGQVQLSEIVYKTNFTNCYILPTVHTVTNAPILLQDKKFPEMLDILAKQFDYVIVDTPPLINVADSGTIAGYCDGAVMVVRSGVTPRKFIQTSLNEIERANCKLLGIVLNRVEMKRNPYYYYKYKYYKYGYNYGYYRSYGPDKNKK